VADWKAAAFRPKRRVSPNLLDKIIGDCLRSHFFWLAAERQEIVPRKPRTEARRNRQRILEVAKEAFAGSGANPAVYALTSICHLEYIKRMESVFEVIAEPNRRAILGLLVSSQQSVGEIERQLRMPQPTVSKHLRVLREAGFVESTVDAQRRLYRLNPGPLQEVDAWLAQFRRFWSVHVDALERHLDRMDPATPTKRKTKEKSTRPNPRT
jgi:DNA-binding transcriptional ArsR family regulator